MAKARGSSAVAGITKAGPSLTAEQPFRYVPLEVLADGADVAAGMVVIEAKIPRKLAVVT
jgi:hypothetical protein